MSGSVLNWHRLPYRSGADLVKGTELAQTLYGQRSRFAIVETRSYVEDVLRHGHVVADVCYRVRDAAHCNAEGRSQIVATFDILDKALAYCDSFAADNE